MPFFKRNKKFFFVLLIALGASCQKKQTDAIVTEVKSPTTYELSCVKLIGNIGFACGGDQFKYGELLKTIDGGESWQTINLPDGKNDKQLYALDFLPDGTLDLVGFGGLTFHSDNFGDDITHAQEPRWKNWRSICYRTNNEAFLCASEELDQGFVSSIQRQNGWSHPFITNKHTFAMQHITFADSMTGYIAGFGAIYKTTDGGNTWNFTPAKNDYFTATAWLSPQEGVAIGWEGSILKTKDGGDNWKSIRSANAPLQKKIRLKSLAMNNNMELVAVGERGCILYSNDRGLSWKKIATEKNANLESVSFRDDDTFFAVGDGGRIFKVQL